ncbi:MULTISPECIES: alpha/beta fold hydrolase [unclassified Brevundimonas]|uniref:alpha/beta fold hydrolase n=1 Tax=unclassified Brevundimonas TaxID=2622653 RepID=UPI0025C52E92|nr:MULTISPECIES: alpha/beta fold hydrolase [unclassified Brevundimonas]
MKTVSALLISVLLLGMGACAPTVQQAMTPPAGFQGPQIVERAHSIGEFVVQDGARLPFHRWSPKGEPRAVIIALHGFNDHAASFRLAGPWWAEQGIEVWAYDQRGFGGAPNRGIWADPELSRKDLRTVVALVRARHPDTLIAIAGESMGGAIGITAFSSEKPPQADRLILLGPAVWGWSSQNPLNRIGLWGAARFAGAHRVEPPSFATRRVRATDNVTELLRNGRDPRFILSTRFDALHGLVDLMEEASLGLSQVRVPTLLAYGAHDQIITKGPMRLALDRAADNPYLQTAYYPQGWHLLNRDLGAEAVYADIAAWLDDKPLPSSAVAVRPAIERSRS